MSWPALAHTWAGIVGANLSIISQTTKKKAEIFRIPTLMCMNLYLLLNQQLAVAPGVEVGVLISEHNAKQKSFIFQ